MNEEKLTGPLDLRQEVQEFTAQCSMPARAKLLPRRPPGLLAANDTEWLGSTFFRFWLIIRALVLRVTASQLFASVKDIKIRRQRYANIRPTNDTRQGGHQIGVERQQAVEAMGVVLGRGSGSAPTNPSCIFDLHAAVEIELRRIFYHTFKAHLILTDDEEQNGKTLAAFENRIERLGLTDMYRVLEPCLNSWPYPDLASIRDINETLTPRRMAMWSACATKDEIP